jgi:hypothetical protein
VRFLLDAHVSGRAIGGPLRAAGHDVLALSDDPSFRGMDDPDVLALATAEGRVLVTFNVSDFAFIAREWADDGRHHAGCIFVVGLDHGEFGAVLRAITAAIADRSDPDAWADVIVFANRASAKP